MPSVGTASSTNRGLLPVIALVVIAMGVAIATVSRGVVALVPLFGVLFVSLIVARPEYGIALFLSTFLMTYPAALQGAGLLTINNVLGGIFLVLLTYKLYREEDFWFLRNRELQLFGFILLMYYLSDLFNSPDAHVVELLGVQEHSAANLKTFVNRVLFTVFFINFVRAPEHVRMIYLLALAFMVASALSGIQGVLRGGGLYGYRATTEAALIASAYNPNRLAMFAILAIAGLWYLMRSLQVPGLRLIILPAIGVLALAVFMTASRSGLLGLVVCGVAILIDEGANLRSILSIVIAALLVILLVLQFVPQRAIDRITNLPGTASAQQGEGSGSLERRQRTWEIAVELFADSPILGVGMGNWEVARFLKDPARSTAAPHSSYLLALVEGGILCFAAFMALLWQTWRDLRFVEARLVEVSAPLSDLMWIVKGAKVSFVVLVFFSAFADLWQLVILFWLVGLAVVMRHLLEEHDLREALAY
ncbi:MAG TPA: O-antigen ligase family protein [Candidatus Acidoferrales bacterium]|nr:O-antigen ligase family protein [Candidatus Acidoferrales bacterium]